MSLTIAETTPPRDPGATRAPGNTGDEAPGAEFAWLLGQTLPQALPAQQGACTPGKAQEAAATTAPASDDAEDAQVLDLLATSLAPAFAPQPAPPAMPGVFTPLPVTNGSTPELPPASPQPTVTPLTPSAAASISAGTASALPLPDPPRAGGARAEPAPALLPVDGEPAVGLRTGAALSAAASAARSVAISELADGAQGWLEAGPEGVGDPPVGEPVPGGQDAGLPLSRTTLATAQPGPEAAAPSLQRHGEDIRDLAARMGEALGRRLIAEIARGNWQLKLKLNPATLGQIEVSMQMRDGELDASFAASQAMTRELLGEGLGRLRETLSSMGMNIANLDVADGHGSRHGGGSTPRPPAHWQQARAAVGATTPVEPAPVRLPAGSQGLDVIV